MKPPKPGPARTLNERAYVAARVWKGMGRADAAAFAGSKATRAALHAIGARLEKDPAVQKLMAIEEAEREREFQKRHGQCEPPPTGGGTLFEMHDSDGEVRAELTSLISTNVFGNQAVTEALDAIAAGLGVPTEGEPDGSVRALVTRKHLQRFLDLEALAAREPSLVKRISRRVVHRNRSGHLLGPALAKTVDERLTETEQNVLFPFIVRLAVGGMAPDAIVTVPSVVIQSALASLARHNGRASNLAELRDADGVEIRGTHGQALRGAHKNANDLFSAVG